jgi:membrane protein DedA with SNARE-associated domain
MHLFTDYIQPLSNWLNVHPRFALIITFLISFSESMAVIGSIIPGSFTMTAIGILAGSGVMRIDLTCLMATLGAIAGDSFSYMLGYMYSDRLTSIWPFKRYPHWIRLGSEFFARHGSMSVIIGRFFGPMRSIIPLIAGMVRMNRWQFLFANIVSAIGWALLYLFPGILIGIASTELSPEYSTRLFIVILFVLISIWLVSVAIRWLFRHTRHFLHKVLHRAWYWGQHQPRLSYYANYLTPPYEIRHYRTAAFFASFVISLVTTLIIFWLVLNVLWINLVNQSVYIFFQSLRIDSFDCFFSLVYLFLTPLPLLTIVIGFSAYTAWIEDWRTLKYWLSLCLSTAVIICICTKLFEMPLINSLFTNQMKFYYPSPALTFMLVIFYFIIFFLKSHSASLVTTFINIVLISVLLSCGITLLYFGDSCLISIISSYFIATTIFIGHWGFYRIHIQSSKVEVHVVYIALLIFVLSVVMSYPLYYQPIKQAHEPLDLQYIIQDTAWWKQQQPILPLYSTNRIGTNTGLLNIQYVGSIGTLKSELVKNGWQEQPSSLFYSLLLRASGHRLLNELPFMAELYQHTKPVLMMTKTAKPLVVVRFWRSNYHLKDAHEPIWLGSIMIVKIKPPSSLPENDKQLITINNDFLAALRKLEYQRRPVENGVLNTIKKRQAAEILIIREPSPTH